MFTVNIKANVLHISSDSSFTSNLYSVYINMKTINYTVLRANTGT